jgi:hypothetical protein
VVSYESHFYSFPMFIAGLAGIALAPVAGASVGVPLHSAFPSTDTGLIAGFSTGFSVLAAGIALAVVGGHQVTREVHAISGRVQAAPSGIAVSF